MKLLVITVFLLVARVYGCRFACDPEEPLSTCVRDPTDDSYQLFSPCRLRDAQCNRQLLKWPQLVEVCLSKCEKPEAGGEY